MTPLPFRKSLGFIALFCFSSPLWIQYTQVIGDQSLFLKADSLVWLGTTIAAGFLFARFFPSSWINFIDAISSFIKRNFKPIALIFLALLFISLMWVNKKILHSFMNSADEHSCYFLAECIRNGKFWAKPHSFPEFFEAVHIGNKNGKWFSVYPPGWPLLMAAALQLNILDWLNPILMIFSLILFYKIGEKIFSASSATLGLAIMSFTPFFLFNSASYFSHASCLLFIAIFLYSFLKWEETGNSAWAAVTAFSSGYGLGTRYLTMAAILAPFLGFVLLKLVRRQIKWNKSHTVFTVIFLAMWLVNFYYNFLITGNPFDAPNHFYHNWERLGFRKDYTPLTALIFVVNRFFYLMDWMPPAFLVIYLTSAFKKIQETIEQKLFRFGFFYVVIGYVFYYSWGGNQYGPRYYFEGIPFLFLILGDRIIAWWNHSSVVVRKFILGVIIASITGNFYLLQKQTVYFERVSRERKSLYDLAETTIQKPSVVFVKGFLGDALVMGEEDAIRNRPKLNDKILYARDLGQKNVGLKQYYPDRDFYFGSYDRQHKLPKLESYRNL